MKLFRSIIIIALVLSTNTSVSCSRSNTVANTLLNIATCCSVGACLALYENSHGIIKKYRDQSSKLIDKLLPDAIGKTNNIIPTDPVADHLFQKIEKNRLKQAFALSKKIKNEKKKQLFLVSLALSIITVRMTLGNIQVKKDEQAVQPTAIINPTTQSHREVLEIAEHAERDPIPIEVEPLEVSGTEEVDELEISEIEEVDESNEEYLQRLEEEEKARRESKIKINRFDLMEKLAIHNKKVFARIKKLLPKSDDISLETLQFIMKEIIKYIPASERNEYNFAKENEAKRKVVCSRVIDREKSVLLKKINFKSSIDEQLSVPTLIFHESSEKYDEGRCNRLVTINRKDALNPNPPRLAITEHVRAELLRIAIRHYLPLIGKHRDRISREYKLSAYQQASLLLILRIRLRSAIQKHNRAVEFFTQSLSEKEKQESVINKRDEEKDLNTRHAITVEAKEYDQTQTRKRGKDQEIEVLRTLISGTTSTGTEIPTDVENTILNFITSSRGIPQSAIPRYDFTSPQN